MMGSGGKQRSGSVQQSDGGGKPLLDDLITAVQEKIPIKVTVLNNRSLGFVELEMKVEGLLDAYTSITPISPK